MEGTLSTVSLAAIALASLTVGGIIWVVKYSLKQLSSDLKEHTKAATELAVASRVQTESNQEVLKFMKNLNGKLEGAFISKVEERRNRNVQ